MLRWLLAAATLALLSGAAVANPNPTAMEIFTPVQNDLALVNLRKLLGCVVDGVWTAAACSDTRPLTVALGYFNVACLIVATILACYLLYSLVADTANDGQPFGRATNTKYTLLRVMTGAILALPIKSGLSLVQILVVQVAVWGSGFGDTLWTKVAGTQLTGMYGNLSAPQAYDGDFILRGTLARAMEGRLYGHVCAQALTQYAANVSGNPGAASIQSTTTPIYGTYGSYSTVSSTTYHFADNNGYFRRSNNLCGGVTYEYTRLNAQLTDTNDASLATQLITLAEQQAQTIFQAAIASLDAQASAIATQIVTGSRDDVTIKNSIKTAIDAAYTIAAQSITQTNNSQLQSAIRNYLNTSNTNGWLSAALWQRSLSAVQVKLSASSAAATSKIDIIPPGSINSYIPLFGHSGSAYVALADKAQRDLTYVAGFNGFFAAQGYGTATTITSDSQAKEFDATTLTGKAIAMIYSSIFKIVGYTEDGTWRDPILETQSIGQSIAYWTMGTATAGAAASATSEYFDSDSTFKKAVSGNFGATATFLFFITTLLFAAAFLLIGLVPFIIIVHFLMATFNWFLVIAEAMVAVPVWLLTKFMPARSDTFVGNSGQGYLFFLGILLRPALIVIGLLLALLLMRVGLDITHLFFRGALAMLSPDGGIATAMIGASGIFVYALVMFSIIVMAAGQISALPETVLGWIGNQVERRSGHAAAIQAAGIVMPSSPSQIGRSAAARGMGNVIGGSRTMIQHMRGNTKPSGNNSKIS